jgi:hypothetical protein
VGLRFKPNARNTAMMMNKIKGMMYLSIMLVL